MEKNEGVMNCGEKKVGNRRAMKNKEDEYSQQVFFSEEGCR